MFSKKTPNKFLKLMEVITVIVITVLLVNTFLNSFVNAREKAKIAKTIQWQSTIHRFIGNDIVGWWNFDEGRGKTVKDYSGNNDGVLFGDFVWGEDSWKQQGHSVYFGHQNSYMMIENNSITDVKKELTITAWVNFYHLDYSDNTGIIFSIATKGNPNSLSFDRGWLLQYDNRNNRNSFNCTAFGNLKGGKMGDTNNFGDDIYNYNFKEKTWNHILITINETEARLFVNGVQVGPQKKISNLNLSDISSPIIIGNNFHGLIDDVRIYKKFLSVQDVTIVYNETKNKYLAEN